MEARILRRVPIGVAVIAALAAACTPSGAEPVPSPPTSGSTPEPGPAPVRVVFFVDSSLQDSLELVASAQLAMQLRFDQAIEAGTLPPGSEVATMDTEGDVALALAAAEEAAGDPEVVAAVEGPFLRPSAEAREVLADAGVPVVSLSTLGRAGDSGTWLRLVPRIETVARAIAGLAGDARRICVTGDRSTYSHVSSRAVARAIVASGGRVVHRPAEELDVDRCASVVWTGAAAEAAALVGELRRPRPRLPVVLTDLARTRSFLEAVDAPRAVTAVCACVDLSTAIDERAVTLVHDFQEAHGLPLGPYGAEGYDLGGLMVELIGPRGAARDEVAAALRGPISFDGVGGSYAFGPDRERSDPNVYLYRATATRWLPIGSA